MYTDVKTTSNMIMIYLEGLHERQLVPGLQLRTCCRRNGEKIVLPTL